MKKHSTLALGLVTLLLSGSAFAAWSVTPVTLTQVEVDASATASNGTATYLGFAATPSNKPACGTAPQGELTGSVDNVKGMTSVATAAFLGGKTVRVYWDGTCDGTYARIANILMQ
jgi:hypothetical protein